MNFLEHRRERFIHAPVPLGICEYLEQLASQTGTNIDHWELEAFEGLEASDRRGINRVFFARQAQNQTDEANLDDHSERLLASASHQFEGAKEERLTVLRRSHTQKLTHAKTATRVLNERVKEAWDIKKEMYALQQRPANYVTEEVRKLLKEGFWSWHKYENGKLFLRTKNTVVLTEVNAASGVNRRVVMGKYLASLKIADEKIQVHRYQQNIVIDGYYHPYVDNDGDICWGTAGSTATEMLANGGVYDIFSLLSSLLTTYAPDATPYARLYDFEDSEGTRQDGDEHSRNTDDDCENCGEHMDDCNCHFCEICQNRSSDPCGDHFCSVCNSYSRHPEECCCTRCERSNDDCECCHECSNTHEDCTRCRECDRHEGHESNCEHHVAETSETAF